MLWAREDASKHKDEMSDTAVVEEVIDMDGWPGEADADNLFDTV